MSVLVGGPFDGKEIASDGAVLRVPIMFRLEPFRKVVPFRRGPEPTFETAEYRRFGDIFWYEGLIGDASAGMDVSAEVWADDSAVRRLVREMLRKSLQALDPQKDLYRIVWRISKDGHRSMLSVKALVGPRRVEYGLHLRTERRR